MGQIGNTNILHSVKRAIEESRMERYNYDRYLETRKLTKEEMQKQKNVSFDYEPLVSVITQIGESKSKYLDRMIESVIGQTYMSFELCIADNSITDEASNIIAKYITEYPQIRYVRTKGIYKKGENLNEALNMAQGDYVLYVRPSDELTPDALYELVKAINRRERVDVVYADEDTIMQGSDRLDKPVFKPNMNYDLLRNTNYIGCPMLVRKKLAKRVGGYNDKYEGAQEYDFTLRCIEGSDKVNHVARILYHSRDGYFGDTDNEAMASALAAHFNRMGIMVDVHKRECPGHFKINYQMESTPHVTIIINDVSNDKKLKRCIDSIRSKTIYAQYDIIVRKNGTKLCAEQIEGDYVITLDSDMVVLSGYFIERLVERISQGDVSVVTAKVIGKNKRIIHAGIKMSKGKHKYLFANMPAWQYGYCQRAVLQQNVDAFPMFSAMLKKDDYLKVNLDNLVDEIDVKLCERLSVNNMGITFEPDVLFQKDR